MRTSSAIPVCASCKFGLLGRRRITTPPNRKQAMKNVSEMAERTLQSMILTGGQVRTLMRKNKITIRQLANKMGVTLKQVRKYRELGRVHKGHGAAMLIEWLTGSRRIYILYCARAGNLPMCK